MVERVLLLRRRTCHRLLRLGWEDGFFGYVGPVVVVVVVMMVVVVIMVMVIMMVVMVMDELVQGNLDQAGMLDR